MNKGNLILSTALQIIGLLKGKRAEWVNNQGQRPTEAPGYWRIIARFPDEKNPVNLLFTEAEILRATQRAQRQPEDLRN